MFRIGSLFDLADSAVARAGLAVAGILTVLALGADASGLLDLSGLVASFPLLALGGALLGSMWAGATVAAWISAERADGNRPESVSDVNRAPGAPDHSPEQPVPEPRRSFCERVCAGRLVTEEIRSRGDF
jgi:hypothetical protein